jgi:hypothetical protein
MREAEEAGWDMRKGGVAAEWGGFTQFFANRSQPKGTPANQEEEKRFSLRITRIMRMEEGGLEPALENACTLSPVFHSFYSCYS